MKNALLLVTAFGLALLPEPALAALAPAQIAKRGLGAVVVVRAEKKGSSPTELSGFLVDKNVVATLASAVQGADRVHVRLADDDKWLEVGPVVARDKANDLILLELKEKSSGRPLSFAREDPSIGETVYAVAAPPKTKGVFHRGLVSGLVENAGRTFVQMDAVVPAGAEGGVLLDESGDIAGVLVASKSDARFSFAIPGSILKALKTAPKKKDPLAGVSMGAAAAWEKGAKAEAEQRWAEAEKAYADAMRLEPKMIRAQKHHARALAAQDKLPEATAGFIAYLDKEPKDTDARFELAEVQRKRGRVGEAFDLFTAYLDEEKRPSRKPYLDHAKRVLRDLTRSFERRVALLPLVTEEEVVNAAEVAEQLKIRIDAKTNLDIVEPASVPLDALPKADAACRQKVGCIWKPAWSRWIVSSKLVPPGEGQAVAVNLELFDVRARQRVATAEVRSQGGNVLPLDIDDGLAVLMADMPAELAGTLKRSKGGGGRRPLLLDDDSAPPDDVDDSFGEGEPVASSSGSAGSDPSSSESSATGSASSSSSPSASSSSRSSSSGSSAPSSSSRRSLRDIDDPPARRETRRVAKAEQQSGGGIPIFPWLLIASGVSVAGAGMAFDLLSPTSANYNLGLLDFVGPAALGVGAAAIIGGVIMGPFGGDEDES